MLNFVSHCPHCRSINFRHVDIRNVFEEAFQWIMQPCRCELCGRHFFLFRWHLLAAEPK
jgi:hypothetical protein